MFKAYKPAIEERFVLQELGFGDDESESGREFLTSAGCCQAAPEAGHDAGGGVLLDTKTSVLVLPKDESGLLL